MLYISKSIIIVGLLFTSFSLFSQNNQNLQKANKYLDTRNEVYFGFSKDCKQSIIDLNEIISIDNTTRDSVFAYANKDMFKEFLKTDIPFATLTPPSLITDLSMSHNLTDIAEWDIYPTYDAYLAMMYQFAIDYPQICIIENLGHSVNGREILAVKISDNVTNDEPETEFFYTSTMHGDELTGMILTLRLIDDILSNYGSNQRITNLINNFEIWINPLANPDGTYSMGNSTVNGATRFNENGVDLNRNFPDPENGLHPDGYPWQPETIAMMEFMNSRNFVLSANFHTGYEVVNYPWDTWPTLHADNLWFENISRHYVDTVHDYSGVLGNYFIAENNGITNGYDWYTTNGSRQDFANYFHNTREVTIELSFVKSPPPALLPHYWEANYRSLYNYIENCYSGFYGIVKDSISQDPISAKIEILNHDFNNSEVYSDDEFGYYHRLINPGSYDVYVTAPGYLDKLIENINITENSSYELDVELLQIPMGVSNISHIHKACSYPNPTFSDLSVFFTLDKSEKAIELSIINSKGEKIYSIKKTNLEKGINQINLSLKDYPTGTYSIELISRSSSVSHKVIKLNN